MHQRRRRQLRQSQLDLFLIFRMDLSQLRAARGWRERLDARSLLVQHFTNVLAAKQTGDASKAVLVLGAPEC